MRANSSGKLGCAQAAQVVELRGFDSTGTSMPEATEAVLPVPFPAGQEAGRPTGRLLAALGSRVRPNERLHGGTPPVGVVKVEIVTRVRNGLGCCRWQSLPHLRNRGVRERPLWPRTMSVLASMRPHRASSLAA